MLLSFCFVVCLPSLQDVPIYRKLQSISATQPRENKEATVTGTPRSMGFTRADCSLRWIWKFDLSLCYDRAIIGKTVGKVKI